MTVLHAAPVSHRQLTWDPASRRFIGEMSSTNGLGRVYDDSCDEGLTIIGRTGREVTLVVNHVEIDPRENEILWWDLVPAVRADRVTFKIAGARIFND